MADISNLRKDFRAILRSMASTVTIISTWDAGQAYGIAVTATTSVSFDPPSHMICVNKSASIHAPLQRRGSFCVNILAHANADIGRSFASSSRERRFEQHNWATCDSRNPLIEGLPYLPEAQAVLFCSVQKEFEFGTHTLFVATIEDAQAGQHDSPLLYCNGTFGEFTRSAPSHSD